MSEQENILERYTVEELENEIKRRKITRPKLIPKSKIDLDRLIECCERYFNDLLEGYHDDDHTHWIYATALETLYGKDVWTFINKNTE